MDTRSKRASAVACAIAWAMAVPLPDGTVAQGDRQHTAMGYSGIDAGAPVSNPTSATTYLVSFPASSSPARCATVAAVASVAAPTAAATLAAAQDGRVKFLIYNDSTQVLYVKFGTGATASDYSLRLAAGDAYESSSTVYTGVMTGLWASANGYARVTTLTEQA